MENSETARSGTLTDVPGIRVGHDTLARRPTGCTVVLPDAPAVAGVDVRGSAPGTRETDLLDPVKSVQRVNGLFLSGGSAFGLDVGTGVVRYLEERGEGFKTGAGPVPIVPGAILFDLSLGDGSIRPDAESGYRGCLAASDRPVPTGNVGAGAGATVGKLLGMDRAMKGGVGSASVRVGELVVAALAAVNCIGDVRDPETDAILAGARDKKGTGFANLREVLRSRLLEGPGFSGESTNTTLAVVATNADFNQAEMTKVAQMGQDGLARSTDPAHLPFDGDVLFALCTGRLQEASLSQVGALAADVTARAVVNAVLSAESIEGFPAHRDLRRLNG